MAVTKLLLENALAIRPCNCEAALEPLLLKVARCLPVLSSRYTGNSGTKSEAAPRSTHKSFDAGPGNQTRMSTQSFCKNWKNIMEMVAQPDSNQLPLGH